MRAARGVRLVSPTVIMGVELSVNAEPNCPHCSVRLKIEWRYGTRAHSCCWWSRLPNEGCKYGFAGS